MERRDVLRGIALVPAATLLEDGTRIFSGDTVSEAIKAKVGVELQGVKWDMQIRQEKGHSRRFRLNVVRKPWPEIGQRVWFNAGSTRFGGVVEAISMQSNQAGRWTCEVEGVVEMFEGEPLAGD